MTVKIQSTSTGQQLTVSQNGVTLGAASVKMGSGVVGGQVVNHGVAAASAGALTPGAYVNQGYGQSTGVSPNSWVVPGTYIPSTPPWNTPWQTTYPSPLPQWQLTWDDQEWSISPSGPEPWHDGPELVIGDLIEMTVGARVSNLQALRSGGMAGVTVTGPTVCRALVIPASFGSHAMCPCRDALCAHYHVVIVDGDEQGTRRLIAIGTTEHGTVKLLSRGA